MKIAIERIGRDDWKAVIEAGNGQRAALDEAYNRKRDAVRGARRFILAAWKLEADDLDFIPVISKP